MRRVLMTLGLVIGVSACSGRSDAPQFSASGYIADSAVVRIWRHDDSQQHPQVIMTVYSPYRGDVTRVTFYEYQNGILRQIRQSDIGKEAQAYNYALANRVLSALCSVNWHRVVSY